jgi:UDP-N-acetylmuramyl pentapeptide phosphotransferase/UDP-N-acetylglucosamine-1-phosphate transferase
MMEYLLLCAALFIIIILYFRVAERYGIVDSPNERSSHQVVTIRGGGIVFLFAALAVSVLYPVYWLFVSGIFIVGIISFLDDWLTLSYKIRLLFQVIAVSLIFWFINVFVNVPYYFILLLYILVTGIINMYNFMDGINGITGAYSLVVFGGLQYVNLRQTTFIDENLIWIPMLACAVFLYFNFRKKARCFAGDVGSVTIALWIITLLLKLVFISGQWAYLLFLSVYGVDAVLTIVHRLILKQNIFEAHRLHLYQVLVNHKRIPHLMVAKSYAVLQALIILIVIYNSQWPVVTMFMLIIIPLMIAYVGFKYSISKIETL